MTAKCYSYLVDGIQHKLTETTNVTLAACGLAPFPFLGIIELISPETLHELGRLNFELGGVNFGKLFQGESPPVET